MQSKENTNIIKTISKEKFNTYRNCFSEIPPFLGHELAWFSDFEEKILATIFFDRMIFNYSAIIFEQDAKGQFSITISEDELPSRDDAIQWIIEEVQVRQKKEKPVNIELKLFKDIVAETKQHPYYKSLKNNPEWNSAKNLINAILPYYTDIDGNFIQQFQSDGFDQRLWELYLFNYFNEENLEIDRSKSSPDFVLKLDNQIVGVEAVTISNRKDKSSPSNLEYKIPDEGYLRNTMPLLWSGAISNKLEHVSKDKGSTEKKHYWEKEGLIERPFVIAIQDFHEQFSMTWSYDSLCELLYGFRYTAEQKNDDLIITPHKIDSYTKTNGTKIPSGLFFTHPNAKYLSAIIANPLGTLSKINRIGKERGFDNFNTIMIHHGICYNHEKNALEPNKFFYVVAEGQEEMWGHGVVVYHNPNCLYPLDEDLFPNACHYRLKNDLVENKTPPFSPFSSMTTILKKTK